MKRVDTIGDVQRTRHHEFDPLGSCRHHRDRQGRRRWRLEDFVDNLQDGARCKRLRDVPIRLTADGLEQRFRRVVGR